MIKLQILRHSCSRLALIFFAWWLQSLEASYVGASTTQGSILGAQILRMSSDCGTGAFFTSSETGDKLYYETWSPENAQGAPLALFFTGVHESADTATAKRLAKAFNDEG